MPRAIKIIDGKEEEKERRTLSAIIENARRTEPEEFVVPDFVKTNGKRRREIISVHAQKIGDRIRLRRRELGWNQGKLATELRVSQDSVSRYEAGITDLTASELPRIAEALKVPVAYFFEPFSYSSAQAVTEVVYGPSRRSEILSEAELAELRHSLTTENETLRFFQTLEEPYRRALLAHAKTLYELQVNTRQESAKKEEDTSPAKNESVE